MNHTAASKILESMIDALSPHQTCHLIWLLLNQLEENRIEITVLRDSQWQGSHILKSYHPTMRGVLKLEIVAD